MVKKIPTFFVGRKGGILVRVVVFINLRREHWGHLLSPEIVINLPWTEASL